MNDLSRDSILEDFARIKIFQRGEQRAVHKPLLILFAVGRMAKGDGRLMDFAAIEGEFKSLLQERVDGSYRPYEHRPYWAAHERLSASSGS